jgi:plasmid stabilization system protein ParE
VTSTLEFLDEALEEAEGAARWYAERSGRAGILFAEELHAAVAQIGRSPTTWTVHDHNTRRYLLRRFPYSVVYRIDATRIVIVAVAHEHRRPGYWRVRLENPG